MKVPGAVSMMATDGSLIYLGGPGVFGSYNPQTGAWRDLALPTINLSGKGGLSYHDGEIYATEGDGGRGFARYSISSDSWQTLPSSPDGTILGNAIDPVKGRLYAAGPQGRNQLYEFDFATQLWSARMIPHFNVQDGGLGYLESSGVKGIYVAQGNKGTGLSRYEPTADLPWLRVSPLAGDLQAGDERLIGLNFNAAGLTPGRYAGLVTLTSNDSTKAKIEIPVSMTLINVGPSISLPQTTVSQVSPHSDKPVKSFTILNTGPAPLSWELVMPVEPWARFSSSGGVIPGKSSGVIDISFDMRVPSGTYTQTIAIRSNDKFNPSLTFTVELTILPNQPPRSVKGVSDFTLEVGQQGKVVLDLFQDPEGDPFTYRWTAPPGGFVDGMIAGNELTFQALSLGSPELRIYATDSLQAESFVSFIVNIMPRKQVTALEPDPSEVPLIAMPNPFDQQTTIRVSVDGQKDQELQIYDAIGRRVMTLVIPAGASQVDIPVDTSHFGAGIYFARLVSEDNRTVVYRMVKR